MRILSRFNEFWEKFGWAMMEHTVKPMSCAKKLKRFIFDSVNYHAVYMRSKWEGRKSSSIRKWGPAMAAYGTILELTRPSKRQEACCKGFYSEESGQ